MGNCVIFCAGEFDTTAEPLGQKDLIVAADGGLDHLKKLGRKPDLILGDFDSLGYVPEGAEVYPVERTIRMPCWPCAVAWSWVTGGL